VFIGTAKSRPAARIPVRYRHVVVDSLRAPAALRLLTDCLASSEGTVAVRIKMIPWLEEGGWKLVHRQADPLIERSRCNVQSKSRRSRPPRPMDLQPPPPHSRTSRRGSTSKIHPRLAAFRRQAAPHAVSYAVDGAAHALIPDRDVLLRRIARRVDRHLRGGTGNRASGVGVDDAPWAEACRLALATDGD
jgi:hypothetical protein